MDALAGTILLFAALALNVFVVIWCNRRIDIISSKKHRSAREIIKDLDEKR